MIETLTKEQEARIPEFVERWCKIGLSTETLDPARVRTAVDLAYQCAQTGDNKGLAPPGHLEFTASPLDLAKKIVKIKGLEETPANLDQALNEVHWNSHNVGYLAFYDYCREVLGLTEETKQMAGLWACSREFGWWAPYENAAVVMARPQAIHLDGLGRLHHESRKAVEYPDGWGLYCWKGVVVDQVVIETPEKITVKSIDEERNAEVRRVKLERFGTERYLREAGAKVLDEVGRDHEIKGLQTARLLRRDLEDDEPIVMVDLLDSSPEADGVYKRYMIRVPPDTTTCRQAWAWINGKTPDARAPLGES